MPKYMTKQRKALLSFLSEHTDEELSARQIAQMLNDDSISVSAVYRNLSALEQEGKIRRIAKSGSREVFYQYTDSSFCKDCLHLSCEKCGKTYHMNMPDADRLVAALAQNDDFAIDKSATVLYGVCRECKNQS